MKYLMIFLLGLLTFSASAQKIGSSAQVAISQKNFFTSNTTVITPTGSWSDFTSAHRFVINPTSGSNAFFNYGITLRCDVSGVFSTPNVGENRRRDFSEMLKPYIFVGISNPHNSKTAQTMIYANFGIKDFIVGARVNFNFNGKKERKNHFGVSAILEGTTTYAAGANQAPHWISLVGPSITTKLSNGKHLNIAIMGGLANKESRNNQAFATPNVNITAKYIF